MIKLRILQAACVIGVHPDPKHFPVAADLIFPNHRDIVLYFTCHEAGVAADARRQIDRHAPLISGGGIFSRFVQRFHNTRGFDGWLYEIRVSEKLLQCPGAINLPFCAINSVMGLRCCQFVPAICFCQNQIRRGPGLFGMSQPVCVEANAGSDPATTVFVKDSRYDKMIEAFGGVGVNATSPDELKRAVNEAMDAGKPTLINAVIDPAAGSESGRIGNLNPQSALRKK